MKKIITIVIALCMMVPMAGCGIFSNDNNKILRCPTPGGEYEKIIEVLNNELSSGYTLKYAKYGQLRSAFIVQDLDLDKSTDEALVFYSTKRGSDEVLNVSIFKKSEDKWKMLGAAAVGGTDIEKLELGDIDGNGKLEAVIGWSIYGAPETRVSVFGLGGDIPVPMYESSYSDFTVYDMNSDGKDNLILCVIDTPSSTVKLSMLELEKREMKTLSEVAVDKDMTSIRRFIKAKTKNFPALYIDACYGTDAYFTELVYFDGTRLVAPLYEHSGQSRTLTQRFKDVPTADINGDGAYEIACQTVLPGTEENEKRLYLTEWKNYTESKLNIIERSVISPSGLYKFKIKKDWVGRFSAITGQSSDGMVFYEYSSKKGLGNELFEIRLIKTDKYNSDDYAGWFEVFSNENHVAIAKISNSADGVEITETIIKKRFEMMQGESE